MRRILLPIALLPALAAALLSVCIARADEPESPAKAESPEIGITGATVAELAPLDRGMTDFLRKHKIPGGSLAVVKDGKLVYARGFGLADRENHTPVEPDSLFRIASVSKPITAAAILKLVDEGRLTLDQKVVDLLGYEPLTAVEKKESKDAPQLDDHWRQVTIAHCLSHTGGWDREKSYDPMFISRRIVKETGVDYPITPETIIRYQLAQPLDFAPGERYAYSNFGYSILGRVIEKVTGQPYESYVRQAILEPIGIRTARIGRSLASERCDGEVCYYDVKEQRQLAVVGPGAGKKKVPLSYGVWRQETLDAHGGWIASSIDLAKFAAAWDELDDGRIRSSLLKPETVRAMFSPHADIRTTSGPNPQRITYGFGWTLGFDGEGNPIAGHNGALPCTAATMLRLPNRASVAALTNLGQSPDGKFLAGELEATLARLVEGIDD